MVVVAFSLRARILGECSTIIPRLRVVVVVVVFVVFAVLFCFMEISSRTLIPFFRLESVHCGSAS